MTIRVVVADPDPWSRRGWIALLEAEKGIEPIGVGDAQDVLDRAGEASCAMIVRDPATDLPHELIGALKADFSVPTLVVICESDPSHAAEALDAGAAGVLVADATPTQVVDAVRAACAGRSSRRVCSSSTRKPFGDLVLRRSARLTPCQAKACHDWWSERRLAKRMPSNLSLDLQTRDVGSKER